MNRSEVIHSNFIRRVEEGELPTLAETPVSQHRLSKATLVDLFETQAMSRLLDIISRRLSSRKQSFYTIGSSGHEGNAVFGKVFRYNDCAFLHYRSCALAIQRAKQCPGTTALYDTMLSFVASSEDPISGGRHKVIGSKPLWIPPQTSTIASHLPKAVGMAHAIGLYPKIQHNDMGLDDDSLVICNFGDASLNHSSAQGAINTAAWAAYQLSPMPIVFICEDNGIGISTHTPKGWVEANFCSRPGIKYISCDGLNILDTYRAAKEAEAYARKTRRPVFLHFKTVRLMGHAGSDIEASYHSTSEISATENQDPLLHTAKLLLEQQALSQHEICHLYTSLEQRISRIAAESIKRPKLSSKEEVMRSIWPETSQQELPALVPEQTRRELFSKEQRHLSKPIHMAKHINLALADIMQRYGNTVVFGEDVAAKGGVYGVTQGLLDKFGAKRVTNTLLDEQSILGLAMGLAQAGLVPIAEIQYLAYVHNAEDQLRGEAATLSFFSSGQYTNPMVIRIAGFAYQKGFGGHFHNDNSFNIFRDIPGIIVATPSNGVDAAQLLRLAVELAVREQRVVIIIEPIALYMTMDLYQEGDGLWGSHYLPPTPESTLQYGEIKSVDQGEELAIVSYANGFYLSNKAAKILREQYNIQLRLIDIRWLHPLPESAIVDAVKDCKNILLVDECRRSGSLSEGLLSMLYENGINAPIARLNAEDCFIPLGEAANLVLPSVESIVEKALTITQRKEQDTLPKLAKKEAGAAR